MLVDNEGDNKVAPSTVKGKIHNDISIYLVVITNCYYKYDF